MLPKIEEYRVFFFSFIALRFELNILSSEMIIDGILYSIYA